jgi:hypothetical protein
MTTIIAIAQARNHEGRLELVATSTREGNRDTVWHARRDDPDRDVWEDWRPFGKLDGELMVDALRQHKNEIMVVAVMGRSSDVRYRFEAGTTTWSDWDSQGRPSSGLLRSLALQQNFDDRLEFFVVGQNGMAWHRWEKKEPPGWSDWTSMGLPHGKIHGSLVVGNDPEGRLEAFCVGTVPGSEQALWHRWQKKPGSDWAAWDSLDAPPNGLSDPVLGTNADGRLEVFCVTPRRGELWHRWQQHDGEPKSWEKPWEKLPDDRPGKIGEVAVGLNGDALLTLVATARDGRDLWQRTQAPATDPMPGGWGPWERLPAVPTAPVDSPLLYRNRRGGLGLFLRTPSTGGLYQLTQPTLGGAWTGRRWSSP